MSTRYVQPLRMTVQICSMGLMLWLGVRFIFFVQQVRQGGNGITVPRPDGIEGFLPISGLVGLVAWFKGFGINPVHPAAVVLLLTVLAMSWLLRRSFCSWVCPLATISEYAWKAGFKVFRHNMRLPVRMDISLRTLKYVLLGFFLYSVTLAMPPEAMQAFIFSDYHKMADVRLMDFFIHLSPLALGVVLFLLLASFSLKNPFCRYLCPYGALLGLAALASPVRVTRQANRCVACGVCSQVCPSRIDVMRKTSVASPECIGCWRCVSHCRFNEALSMNFAGRYVLPGIVFAVLTVLILWGGIMAGKWSGHWHTVIDTAEYQRLLGR